VLWLRLSATGVSAHSAYGQGSSAIAKTLRAVKTIEGLRGRTARTRKDIAEVMRRQRAAVDKRWGPGTGRMADHLTLSLGTLRGGGQVNLIPARCEAEVDFRLPPGMTTRALETDVRRRLSAGGSRDVEVTVLNRCDPYVTSPRDRLITTIAANGRVVLGTAPLPVIRLGYTDGRFFRRAGVPTAVYGPRVHRMGGPDEYVEQDEVLQVARVHLATVLDYLDAR
jgi:succinyl-diaminopimelate desuccinylase